MELVDCPHCSGKMSVYANSCPSCGFMVSVELVKKMFLKSDAKKNSFFSQLLLILIGLMFLITLAKVLSEHQQIFDLFQQDAKSYETTIDTKLDTNRVENTITDVRPRSERVQAAFNIHSNGAHQQLEGLIKRSLMNPVSYSVVETGYWDQGDVVIIRMIFEAKNQYNEKFQQLVFAKAKENGDLLSVISPCPVDAQESGGCEKLQFYSQSLASRLLNWMLLSL